MDPNNGDFVLWESGAIIDYLVDTYDKEHKLAPADAKERYQAKQWLFFQVSGQGPYFGQAAWFHFFHSEKLPSARERYLKEISRVTKVLDAALKGKDYLVANRITYADLAFITWYGLAPRVDVDGTGYWAKTLEETPNFKAWLDRLNDRPTVKKINEQRAKAAAPPKQ